MGEAGWELRRLSDLVTLIGGSGFPENLQGRDSGELPFFKVSDMNSPGNERVMQTANNYVDRSLAREQGWRLLPPGTVIFAKVGAALLQNRRRLLGQDALVDNNMMGAIAGDEVDTNWLYWWLQSVDFARVAQVGVLPSVNQRDLGALAIRRPPLKEQRRIAEILNAIEEAIQATDRVIVKRRLLRMALIREQVLPNQGGGGERSLPAGWVDVRIRDALQQYVEPTRIDDHQSYDLISIRRRHGGMFHRESLPGLKILGKNMQRVVPGTFVIARRQIVHGACAIATADFAESMMSMSYSAFVGTPICDVRYFFTLAQTPPMVKRFWDASHGVVVEKLNFQQEQWLDYRVQLPPIEVQREVIAAVNASETEIAVLERELQGLRGIRVGLAADLLSGQVQTVAA